MTDPSLSESGITRQLTALDMEREALIDRLRARADEAESKLVTGHRWGKDKGGVFRAVEDIAFALGVVFITLNVVLELTRGVVAILQEVGVIAHVTHTESRGWLAIIIPPLMEFLRSSLLVVPKILGKATGGAIWTGIGAGIGRRIGKEEGTP